MPEHSEQLGLHLVTHDGTSAESCWTLPALLAPNPLGYATSLVPDVPDTLLAMVDPLPKAESATQVITWNVIPGQEAAFEAWAHDMTTLATRQDGHMGAAWLRPDAPGGPYHVVFRFTTTELLERWMGSNERAGMVAKLEGIASEQGCRQTGLETWFSLPGQTILPPPKWKMAMVTFAAVYPLSILFNWLVVPSVKGWSTVWRAALFPLALVPLLTFVIMPRLSRLLRTWLYGST